MDMRTPTYSSFNDASQQNIPEMWNMDFWTEMLDHLARNRYNIITKDIEMAKNWELGTIKGPLVRRKELNFRE